MEANVKDLTGLDLMGCTLEISLDGFVCSGVRSEDGIDYVVFRKPLTDGGPGQPAATLVLRFPLGFGLISRLRFADTDPLPIR